MQRRQPGRPAERKLTNEAKTSWAFTGGFLNHVLRLHISYVVLKSFHRDGLADLELFRLYFLLVHEELCFLRPLKRENLLSVRRNQNFLLVDHLESPLEIRYRGYLTYRIYRSWRPSTALTGQGKLHHQYQGQNYKNYARHLNSYKRTD